METDGGSNPAATPEVPASAAAAGDGAAASAASGADSAAAGEAGGPDTSEGESAGSSSPFSFAIVATRRSPRPAPRAC